MKSTTGRSLSVCVVIALCATGPHAYGRAEAQAPQPSTGSRAKQTYLFEVVCPTGLQRLERVIRATGTSKSDAIDNVCRRDCATPQNQQYSMSTCIESCRGYWSRGGTSMIYKSAPGVCRNNVQAEGRVGDRPTDWTLSVKTMRGAIVRQVRCKAATRQEALRKLCRMMCDTKMPDRKGQDARCADLCLTGRFENTSWFYELSGSSK